MRQTRSLVKALSVNSPLAVLIGMILFFCVSITSFAQHSVPTQYRYKRIGVNEGLPSAEIYRICQDDLGYIWLGTNLGVSRFDGYTFRNYFQSRTKGLGVVKDIVQDARGTLWIGSSNGLFYIEKGDVHEVSGSDHSITDLHFDDKGQLWVGGMDFVPFKIDQQQLQALKLGEAIAAVPFIDEVQWKQAMKFISVQVISTDTRSNVYFGNSAHLSYFDGQQLTQLWTNPTQASIQFIHAHSPDTILIGDTEFDYRLIQNKKATSLGSNMLSNATLDSDTIYFLSRSGIDRFVNGQLERFAAIEDRSGWSTYWNLDFLIDREQNFWVATFEGILLQLTPTFFTTYEHPKLSTNYSLAVAPNNELWIGSHHASVLKMESDTSFSTFLKPPQLARTGGVRAIHLTKNGNIILATELSGLLIYKDSETYTAYGKEHGLIDDNHYFLFEDKDATLWSGGDGSINEIVLKENGSLTFRSISYKSNSEKPSLDDVSEDYPVFRDMAQDQYGSLWTVSDKGLYVVKANQLFFYSLPPPFAQNPNLIAIESDEQGQLWISTLESGLLQFLPKANGQLELVKHWTTADGLVSNTFLDLHIDKRGRLWMADLKGLCCLDGERLHCFTKADGWFDIVSQQLQMLETEDGLLWTVGYTGMVSFPLYDFQLNQLKPNAILQSITLFDETEDILQYAEGKEEQFGLPNQLTLPCNSKCPVV